MTKTAKLLCLAAIFLTVGLLACKKDNDNDQSASKSPEEYLIGKKWKIDELTFLQGNQFGYYFRNTSGTTINLMNDRIEFKTGGTGTYTSTYDDVYSFTWQFTDTDKTKMMVKISNYANGAPAAGVDLTITYENVHVSDNVLRYTEIFTNANSSKTMSSVKRTPE